MNEAFEYSVPDNISLAQHPPSHASSSPRVRSHILTDSSYHRSHKEHPQQGRAAQLGESTGDHSPPLGAAQREVPGLVWVLLSYWPWYQVY